MSFQAIISCVQICAQNYTTSSKQHLEFKDGVWCLEPGKESNWPTRLKSISNWIEQQVPATHEEADTLIYWIDRIHKVETPYVFRKEHEVAWKIFQEKLSLNIQKLTIQQIVSSLDYFARIQDIKRFAQYYSVVYLRSVVSHVTKVSGSEELQLIQQKNEYEKACRQQELALLETTVAELCDKNPTLGWVQRIRNDKDWVCSLVAHPERSEFIKSLDLKGCDIKSMQAVLEAHKEYIRLCLVFDCTSDVFSSLVKMKAVTNAISIDLRECTLNWPDIEQSLLQVTSTIFLPSAIKGTVSFSRNWSEKKKGEIQARLREAQEDNCVSRSKMTPAMKPSELTSTERRYHHFQLHIMFVTGESCTRWKVMNAMGMRRANATTLLQHSYHNSSLRLVLAYCPGIDKECFHMLHSKLTFKDLNLFGSIQVNDSFFDNHSLCTKPNTFFGKLDLGATQVTKNVIDKIKKAQPGAEVIYSDTFLKNFYLVKENPPENIPNGISYEAMCAIYHLKYTCCMPLMPIEVVFELLEKRAGPFKADEANRALKQFCRYLLSVNIEKENFSRIKQLAVRDHDAELLFVCNTFVTVCMSQEERAALPFVDERQVKSVEKSPDFPSVGQISRDLLHFAPHFAPLAEITASNAVDEFVRRVFAVSSKDALDYIEQAKRKFPNCKWLDEVGTLLAGILHLKSARVTALDLRGVKKEYIRAVLLHHRFEKVKVILNCSEADFVSLVVNNDYNIFDRCRIIDMRGCPFKEFKAFMNCWDKLRNSGTVLYPESLDTIPITTNWLLQLNVIHTLRKKNIGSIRVFEQEIGPEYSQLISMANIVRGYPINNEGRLKWEMVEKPAMNVLFAIPEIQKKALFGPELDFSGLECITTEVLVSLRYTDSVSLDLAFCPNIAHLDALFAIPGLQKVSLYGCRQINNATFARTTIFNSFKGVLDLRGTSVTQVLVDRIQNLGITVYHETDVVMQSGDSEELQAIGYYMMTKNRPQLTVALAKKILLSSAPEELKEFCRHHLWFNVSRGNAIELYHFGKEIGDNTLCFTTRAFIEIFCNPHYPLEKTSKDVTSEDVTSEDVTSEDVMSQEKIEKIELIQCDLPSALTQIKTKSLYSSQTDTLVPQSRVQSSIEVETIQNAIGALVLNDAL